MEPQDVREKISSALKSHDNQAIDEAVKDWLAGLHNDTELAERYEIESMSYDTGTPARQGKDD